MFRYTRFGDTELPEYEPNYDVSVHVSTTVFVDVGGGGVFDAGGTEQLEVGQTTLSHRATVVADDDDDFETQVRALRKLRGTRANLYREWRSGEVEFVEARCVAVNATRGSKMTLHQEFDLQFVVLSPVWYGDTHAAWVLDDGEYLDDGLNLDQSDEASFTLTSSPQAETVPNDGDATVRNAIITVTAGDADITALTIGNSTTSAEIEYTATITSGDVLEIDCGAFSVENDGSDDYDNFALTSNHAAPGWFPLAAGDNSITITFTGGGTGSTVEFGYRDGWH